MKTFTANDGTSWNIHITAGSLLRIHTMCGVDLLNNPLDFPTGIAELVGVLWATIQPQAQQAGISAEKFGEGLGGLELATAADIFVDELGFFFYGPEAATESDSPTDDVGDVEESSGAESDTSTKSAWRDLYRLAGVAGIDPAELQLWQILELANGARPELLGGSVGRDGKIPLTKNTISALKVFV